MKLPLLPRYQGTPSQGSGSPAEPVILWIAQRRARLVRDLAWLVLILALLWWLKRATSAIEQSRIVSPPPGPIDFALVEERYEFVREFGTREEVEQILGAPSERDV